MRRLSIAVFLTICLATISFGQPASQGPINLPVLPSVNVTVLVENMAGGGPVLGEWGLAYLIETGQHRILFDTGSGFTLPGNAKALDVDLAKIDAIVISHGHIDHTGGLVKELETCGPVDLFIHPSAFATRYYKEGLRFIEGGASLSAADVRPRVRALHETIKPAEIGGGLMVTGEVPRETDFEDTGLRGNVFMDPDGKTEDLVQDDQSIFFRVPEGVVVLLGCAHAGVVNTIQYVSKLTGEKRIYAVMGGTHLITASPGADEENGRGLPPVRTPEDHALSLHRRGCLRRGRPGLSRALQLACGRGPSPLRRTTVRGGGSGRPERQRTGNDEKNTHGRNALA